jgi:threonine dehydrogenase-like Zn-dependent dehydrogenase
LRFVPDVPVVPDELPFVMPAAVYRSPGVVTVEDRPVPRPGTGQVLVRVHHCGICGSDIHQLRDGWGFKPGAVAGHEWTGTIAAVGDDVEDWSIGERVVGGSSPKCGSCRRCREGKPSQCENRSSLITDNGDGAFAEFILVRAAGVLRLPDGLSARHAALAEPLAVALHGITRSGIAPGDTAMVIGAGPIGTLTVAALRAMGVDSVTAVEPSEGRKRLAHDVGATEVLDPSDLEIFPSREPEKISSRAVHVVFECSGKKEAVEAGFHQLRRGGVLVLVGAGIEHPTFDSNRMILNELHVCGSFVYDLGGFEHALALLSSGQIPNDLFIDPDDVPLNGVTDALEALATGRIAGKVMVVPEVRTP